jgi:hypothetical protein
MRLRLAPKDENAAGSPFPDSGGVARRAPGWLCPEAENVEVATSTTTYLSPTEEGSIFITAGGTAVAKAITHGGKAALIPGVQRVG